MALSLVVSVAGLQLRNQSAVITAQGIDELLVLDSPTAYAGQAGVALDRAAALRAENPELTLAFTVGPPQGQLPFASAPEGVAQLVQAVGGRFVSETLMPLILEVECA